MEYFTAATRKLRNLQERLMPLEFPKFINGLQLTSERRFPRRGEHYMFICSLCPVQHMEGPFSVTVDVEPDFYRKFKPEEFAIYALAMN